MTTRLNPYLMFAGEARQALEFYQQVFGGTLTMNTYGQFGAPDADLADKIMHGMLDNGAGFALMGSDAPPGMPHETGTNIVISLSGEDAAELRGYWQQLSEGGSVSVPLEPQMWGDEFGACTDRFGIGWMVNIAQPQS